MMKGRIEKTGLVASAVAVSVTATMMVPSMAWLIVVVPAMIVFGWAVVRVAQQIERKEYHETARSDTR